MARFSPVVHSAELQGGSFSWLEAGDEAAPVILCLHGFPDHPRSFEPLLGDLLAAGYRIVAPWMRGYHPSVKRGPYDGRQLGEDAVQLAGAVSPDRPVLLVGHDWGAVAAWKAAALAPERIAVLVALSVPHPSAFVRNLRHHPGQLLRSWYIGAFQLPILPEKLIAAGDFAVVARLFRRTDGALPPYWDELRETLRASLPAPIDYYRALRRGLRGPSRIRVPTLFLAGRRDAALGVEMAAGQRRWIDAPFAEAVLDTDHFIHHEAPDEVARRIIEFAGGRG